jgi:hypothetical protein
MKMINSYPTVFAIGHRAIQDLFNGSVVVEEKVDGSQFSFGVIDGELQCRSKGKNLILDAPEKMFIKAIASVLERQNKLVPDWIYRGEYLQSPKHNTLAYGRVPVGHIIGFDIVTGPEVYLSPEEKRAEFEKIGLETVPLLHDGAVSNISEFNEFLQRESILGGCKIEGVVVKNYSLFTQEKKVALGKYVSEAFKEVHNADWKTRNPTGKDITQELIERYRTDARWNKAVQHLRESGDLDGSPKDIGPLMKEIAVDVRRECEDEIKQILFNHFWKNIQRGVIAGLPEWYKQELAKIAFEVIDDSQE